MFVRIIEKTDNKLCTGNKLKALKWVKSSMHMWITKIVQGDNYLSGKFPESRLIGETGHHGSTWSADLSSMLPR